MAIMRMYPTDCEPYHQWNVEVSLDNKIRLIKDLSFEQAQDILSILSEVEHKAIDQTKKYVLTSISRMIDDFK